MMGGLMCSTLSSPGRATASLSVGVAVAGVADGAGVAAAAAGGSAGVRAARGVEVSAAEVCGELDLGRLEIRSTTGRGAAGAALTGAGAGVGATAGAFFAADAWQRFQTGLGGTGGASPDRRSWRVRR